MQLAENAGSMLKNCGSRPCALCSALALSPFSRPDPTKDNLSRKPSPQRSGDRAEGCQAPHGKNRASFPGDELFKGRGSRWGC